MLNEVYIVMNHIHKLLLRGKRATLRQLYYSYVDFFQACPLPPCFPLPH